MASAAGGGFLSFYGAIQASRQVEMIAEVVERLGDRFDRLEAAVADTEAADLVRHGLDVARTCGEEEEMRLCAGIVAEGLDDDSGVDGKERRDRAHLLLEIAHQLEPTTSRSCGRSESYAA